VACGPKLGDRCLKETTGQENLTCCFYLHFCGVPYIGIGQAFVLPPLIFFTDLTDSFFVLIRSSGLDYIQFDLCELTLASINSSADSSKTLV
jgi:hypothetical protein